MGQHGWKKVKTGPKWPKKVLLALPKTFGNIHFGPFLGLAWLSVGSCWRLVVGGGWWLAVGGGWRLTAVGECRLAAGSCRVRNEGTPSAREQGTPSPDHPMAIRGSLDPFWLILDSALFYASFCPRLTTAQKGPFDTPQPSATTFENFHFWIILTHFWPTGFGGHPLDPT